MLGIVLHKQKITFAAFVIVFFAPSVCLSFAVQLTDGWVNEAPPGARSVAGYLSIQNTTDTDIVLLRLHTRAFQRVEIHRTVLVDGVARMRKEKNIKIAANTRFELRPGGYHLMLIGPHAALVAGDEVMLELHFSDNIKKTISMPVRRITSAHHNPK